MSTLLIFLYVSVGLAEPTCTDQTHASQTTFKEMALKQEADEKSSDLNLLLQRNKTVQEIMHYTEKKQVQDLNSAIDAKIEVLQKAPGNLRYKVSGLKVARNWSDPNDKQLSQTVDISFSNITAEQFDYLKLKFGLGQSKLLYDPLFRYHLQDFLPPTMQVAYEIGSYGACYHFIAHYLDASYSQFRLIWSVHDALIDRLENAKFFRLLTEQDELMPGDIIISAIKKGPNTINSKREYVIDHAVIYLDDNLTIGANPWEIQYGSIMNGRFLSTGPSNSDLKPVGTFFKNNHFTGNFHLPSQILDGLNILIYRRINWQNESLPLRNYSDNYPVLALGAKFDSMGRLLINRQDINLCE